MQSHSILRGARTCAWLAIIALVLGACASAEEPRLGGFETEPPRGGGGAGERGVLGDDCDTDRDCASDLCVFDPELSDAYCSRWCEEECVEPGWICSDIRDGGQLRGACLIDLDATGPRSGSASRSGAGSTDPGSAPSGPGASGETSATTPPTVPPTAPPTQQPPPTERTPTPSSGSSCEPICTPGDTETGARECGACGEGSESRTRTCAADGCSWGEWSDWGTCQTEATCAPGDTGTDSRDCGPCGATQSRSRICNATTCTWNDWGDYSTCPARTCTPGESTDCAPADDCGHRVCQDNCEWGACEPGPAPQNVCLRVREGSTVQGSNYRCCAPGSWEFCFSNCDWTGNCAPCTTAQCPQCH